MKPKTATPLTDALIETGHPRIDFRTDEAKKVCEFLKPILQPFLSTDTAILDLGCGSGKTTFTAEMVGGKAIGIDCAESAIRFAREVAMAIGSNATFDIGDFADMPYSDGSFEVAMFPNNISECSYDEVSEIARETHRVLKPNGVFIVTMRDDAQSLNSQDPNDDHRWDTATGKKSGTINIPNVGAFSYPTYFWTCAFANQVIGKYLALKSFDKLERKAFNYSLIFEKRI